MSPPLAREIEKFSLSCLEVLLQALSQLDYFLCLENGEKEGLSISIHTEDNRDVCVRPLWSTQRQLILKLPGQVWTWGLSTSKAIACLFTCYF